MPAGDACPSCGAAFHGRFCSECGERRLGTEDRALRRYVDTALDFLTRFDAKGWRALWALIARPGFLSEEQIRGSRVKYPKPLALFLSLNVVYYVSVTLLGANAFAVPLSIQLHQNDYYAGFAQRQVTAREQALQIDARTLETRFNEKEGVLSRTLVFLFIPVYAALLWLLFFRRRRYFVEHAIVATHLWSFILLLLAALVPAIAFPWMALTGAPSTEAVLQANDGPISAILQICIGGYMVAMMRRVYGAGLWYCVLAAVLVSLSFFHILWLYRFVLFLITMHTL